jgi:hypothetical protein
MIILPRQAWDKHRENSKRDRLLACLQYWFKDHIYTDLFVVCGEDSRCLVKNDSPLTAFNGTLRLSALDVTNSASITINSTAVSLTKGAGAATWLCAGGGSPYDRCDSWAATLERSNAVSTPHNNNNIRATYMSM